MPVLNLNGVERKHGQADGRTIKGSLMVPGLAAKQNSTTSIYGTSYTSRFTESGKPLFTDIHELATQPRLAPLKVESPGQLVHVKDFVRIHPHEKGTFFSTTQPSRPVVNRTGGPSKYADTPANPNAPQLKKQSRPVRKMAVLAPEKQTNLSFHRSGGTIGGHVDPQAGTSSGVSRWHVTKKGAVQ